jgi:hypothetical protein
VTGSLAAGVRIVGPAGGQADLGELSRGVHRFPGFADGQSGYLGQLLVHEHEQHDQAADVGDALGVGPVCVGHRPDQQKHLDQRQDHDDKQAGRQARLPGIVLEVAARFALRSRGEPGVVTVMDLTAGPGRPVREPDGFVGQVTAALRGLSGLLRLLDGNQAVLFGCLVVRGRLVMEGFHGRLDGHRGRWAGQDPGRRVVVVGMAAGHRVLDDPDGHGRGLRVAVDRMGFLVPEQIRVVQ